MVLDRFARVVRRGPARGSRITWDSPPHSPGQTWPIEAISSPEVRSGIGPPVDARLMTCEDSMHRLVLDDGRSCVAERSLRH